MAVPYDYSKLKGRIIEKFGTQAAFADAMGISKEWLSKLLNQKAMWTHDQIERACDLLDIGAFDIGCYFFTREV